MIDYEDQQEVETNSDIVLDDPYDWINEPLPTGEKWILVVGSLGFGMRFRGPFDSTDEAMDYSREFHFGERSEIVPVMKVSVN